MSVYNGRPIGCENFIQVVKWNKHFNLQYRDLYQKFWILISWVGICIKSYYNWLITHQPLVDLYWGLQRCTCDCHMIGHNSYELLMNFTSKLRSRLSHSSLTIYFITVDDGSGTIPCCRWRQSEESVDNGQEQLNLGQLVTVQGKISVFREQRQLTVDLICIHFYGYPSDTSTWVQRFVQDCTLDTRCTWTCIISITKHPLKLFHYRNPFPPVSANWHFYRFYSV